MALDRKFLGKKELHHRIYHLVETKPKLIANFLFVHSMPDHNHKSAPFILMLVTPPGRT